MEDLLTDLSSEADADLVRHVWSPEVLRRDGARVLAVLATHFEDALAGRTRVHPAVGPREMAERWPADFPELPAPGEEVVTLALRIIEGSIHQHHPSFTGHQVTAPLPHAALFDFVGALLNNGMAAYESGPASTAMERAVVRWLCGQVGYGERSDGVMTSGGSLGNLTALLVARQARAGFDAWEAGVAGGPPLAILAAEACHYSVARAARILGLGGGAVIPVPVDHRHRLDARALPAALAAAEAAGRRTIAVVASASSTSTGAIDPLDAVADFCESHRLWLHVDGAHGASLVLVPELRGRLRGIERADSVVWDLHKLMLIPSLCTAVLFRDATQGYLAFAQQAPYLFGGDSDASFDLGLRTVECTKRMLGGQAYATLRLAGTRAIAAHIRSRVALAARFAEMIAATPELELAVKPDCNIVCFRPRRGDPDVLRATINATGRFLLTRTRLHDTPWLRTCLQSPLTTEAELSALLAEITRTAALSE